MTVWVGPSGARAGSAGAFIAAASDELGMAPGTNIGSATPIGSGARTSTPRSATTRRPSSPRWPRRRAQRGSYRAMVTDALNLTPSRRGPGRGRHDPAHPGGLRRVARRPPGAVRAHRDGRRADRDRAPCPGTCAALQVLDRPQPGVLPAAGRPRRRGLRDLPPRGDRAGASSAASACCSRSPGWPCCRSSGTGIALLVARGRAVLRRDPGRPGVGALAAGGIVALALGGAFLVRLRRPGARAVASAWSWPRRRWWAARSRWPPTSRMRARRRPSRTGGARAGGRGRAARASRSGRGAARCS